MQHYRKTYKSYTSKLQPLTTCSFCDLDKETRARIIKENKYSYVIKNRTKYDQWEGHDVSVHLMVIPKRHVPHLKELNQAERLEIMDTIADYESQGYNIYARGNNSPRRSVLHQHTHLIKIHGKRSKFMLFLDKPYLLFRR